MHYSRMFTDLIFPPRCPGCEGIISFASRISYYEGKEEMSAFLHKKCRNRFQYNDREFCKRCGTPVSGGAKYCERCIDGRRSFEEGRSVFLYQEGAKEAMMGIKYHSRKEFCDFYALAAVRSLEKWILSKNVGMIIPVPIHPKRRRERGYNQAEELGVRIGSRMGIPCRSDVLLRVQNTKAQKELGPEERKLNLIDAFDIGKKLPEGSIVLLVDDIYTTGATMDMCAWTLKTKGGAGKVFCLSLCTAVHR